MLLDIYLVSTVLSMGISFLNAHTINKRLEREGYKQKEENLSIPEKIMKELKVYCCLIIPIFNILLAVVPFVDFDNYYEKVKEKLLKEGNLIKIQKQNKSEIQSNEKLMLNKNDEIANLSSHSLDVDTHKEFGKMTKDEKVAYLDSLKKSILEMPEDKSNDDGFQKSLKR